MAVPCHAVYSSLSVTDPNYEQALSCTSRVEVSRLLPQKRKGGREINTSIVGNTLADQVSRLSIRDNIIYRRWKGKSKRIISCSYFPRLGILLTL